MSTLDLSTSLIYCNPIQPHSADHLSPMPVQISIPPNPALPPLSPSAVKIGDFEFFRSFILGSGTSGTVYRGTCLKTRNVVAVKAHNPSITEKLHSIIEASYLGEISDHHVPHHLHLRGEYEESPTQHYIITDLIPTQNMYDTLMRFSLSRQDLDEILTIWKQGLEYLNGLEELDIIHGDIKPKNLMYERFCRYLTVVDCSLSTKVEENDLSLLQTSYYRCPEVILKGPVDCSADIWSLACIIIELLCNEPLFPVWDDEHDFVISHRKLLALMVFQIGYPSQSFLDECTAAAQYFQDNTLMETLASLPPQKSWKTKIREAAVRKEFDLGKVEMFISILESMLKYEDRPTPQELLAAPFFSKYDTEFFIADDFYPTNKVYISQYSHNRKKLLVDRTIAVTRTCFHIPRDPHDLYCVEILNEPQKRKIVHLKPRDTLNMEMMGDSYQIAVSFEIFKTFFNFCEPIFSPDSPPTQMIESRLPPFLPEVMNIGSSIHSGSSASEVA